ncbi:MarP family serine protease [Isoptericola variabilis]|uniref:Peptidase S1 and S6 chymotrypsin/Hap n=1 Tax=Isoptericola variabilis (strain 225) TaxID=743718 RepID=F6FQ35_ISOV2|nr:MarP family serine protease [Isoptericola variabilis]AEG44841.1 peptidase S1 and S6 chymotrypsin/Hap [Isoptericola variabilis 225]TWH31637.1 Trypsin-like serine proteases, typically periplasmic, containing C-terminal PDZ domain [Isoptericola variabilis J7]
MTPVDLLLVVALVAALVAGLGRGLLATVGGLAGLVAGGLAAFWVVPVVNDALPTSQWRAPATLAIAVMLPLLGASAGAGVGHGLRRQVDRTPLRPLERLLGGVANLLVAAVAISFVGTAVKATGAPGLAQAVSSSVVLRTIDDLTPTPVSRTLAQMRSAVLDDGLPRLDGLLGPRVAPAAPDVDLADPALEASARSVARIWGTAYACGTSSTGSGFVVAPDRVVTNAHVVAGVERPLVELPGRAAREGRVVYFDPVADLAVVAVDALDADPLPVAPTLAAGDTAAVQGYPYGGPFISTGAQVLDVGTVRVPESGGIGGGDREVYSLAAEVHPGNSGGPVLTTDGEVVGVIFGRADSEEDLAYAVTTAELLPVVAQATELDTAVEPGRCAA